MEELTPRPVYPLVCVCTEIIALGLQHIGRKPFGTISVKIVECGSKSRYGYPVNQCSSHHATPTLLCTLERGGGGHGQAEVLAVPARTGDHAQMDLGSLVALLRRRGLRRLFIEGGGVAVSRFLAAGLLTRLQVTVAPVIIGEGTPGIRLPRLERLEAALRPPARQFCMGRDVLFDLDLAESTHGRTA